MVHETDKSSAGIHLDANGDRVVGGTQRADGSVRKTVKVRPGFIPKEDAQRYDPRAAAERRKQREKSDDRKTVGPGQRQNQTFVAIDDALGGLGGGSSSAGAPQTRGERNNNKGTEFSDDLCSIIANLSIGNQESPSKFCKIQSKHATSTPTSETDREPSKPKKYRPPRPKTKKYSLEDLDNA